jgi:hypothetical protein
MSEGALPRESIVSLFLRLSDRRRPQLSVTAGPSRADEGGGSTRGGVFARSSRDRVRKLRAATLVPAARARYGARGSKPANRSPASFRFFKGMYSQASAYRSHIFATAGLEWAASIAACDFHSKTSTIVPSAARMA